MEKHGFLTAAILGLSIAVAGISVGVGFYKGRAADRYVTVKGLAEREVDADLAIWPITFNVAGNDLSKIQDGIDSSREIITSFLMETGFKQENISYSAPKITDTQTERQYGNAPQSPYRYVAQATVTTRTKDVQKIRKTMEDSGKLVGKGIVLAAESWQTPTEFIFTALNDIKPEMIEEATKDARKAAEKFAMDSGSKVGKIRNATQGYFAISDRDRNSPELKIVRVVTTIEYYLVD
ncbi:MAG: SIMPL domain-containing protein [Candidatus Latescibacteria bacterium]|nr:SIMPL domain-containing protein [Candidatus Latescibacterota bacterium]